MKNKEDDHLIILFKVWGLLLAIPNALLEYFWGGASNATFFSRFITQIVWFPWKKEHNHKKGKKTRISQLSFNFVPSSLAEPNHQDKIGRRRWIGTQGERLIAREAEWNLKCWTSFKPLFYSSSGRTKFKSLREQMFKPVHLLPGPIHFISCIKLFKLFFSRLFKRPLASSWFEIWIPWEHGWRNMTECRHRNRHISFHTHWFFVLVGGSGNLMKFTRFLVWPSLWPCYFYTGSCIFCLLWLHLSFLSSPPHPPNFQVGIMS